MTEDEINETLEVVERFERGYNESTGKFNLSREEVNLDRGTAGSYHVSRAKALDVVAHTHVLPENMKNRIAWAEDILNMRRNVPSVSMSGFEGRVDGSVQAQTLALRQHMIANPEDEKSLAAAVLMVNDDKLGKAYEYSGKYNESVDMGSLTDRQRKYIRSYFYNADVNQPKLRRNLNHLTRISKQSYVPPAYIKAGMDAVIGEMDAVNVTVGGRKSVSAGLVNRVGFLQDRFAGIDDTSYSFSSQNIGEAETFIKNRREAAASGYEVVRNFYTGVMPQQKASGFDVLMDRMNPFSRTGEKM